MYLTRITDGTAMWTAPTGHLYPTTPAGGLFFPAPGQPRPPDRDRTLTMPRRHRTRAAERHHRIMAERRINEKRIAAQPPPPF